MKLVVAAFVQNKVEQSGQPATVSRNVRLQSVSYRDSVDNAKLFDPNGGAVSVDISGATAEILAAFAAGGSVSITIDTGS